MMTSSATSSFLTKNTEERLSNQDSVLPVIRTWEKSFSASIAAHAPLVDLYSITRQSLPFLKKAKWENFHEKKTPPFLYWTHSKKILKKLKNKLFGCKYQIDFFCFLQENGAFS